LVLKKKEPKVFNAKFGLSPIVVNGKSSTAMFAMGPCNQEVTDVMNQHANS
jgi:hypothetical protein